MTVAEMLTLASVLAKAGEVALEAGSGRVHLDSEGLDYELTYFLNT